MIGQIQIRPQIVNNLIDGILGTIGDPHVRFSPKEEKGGPIPVNVQETESGYILELIVPGLAKDKLEITVDERTLSVAFDFSPEDAAQDGAADKPKWLRKEYVPAAFKKSFRLGDKVDAEKIDAQYEAGILRLSLPYKEKNVAASRTIVVA